MATTNAQLVDWLDDLTVRFLLNLPASELSSVPRLCFQVEEAQWFYEDFIRPAAAAAGNPLPSLPLRQFCMLLFQHCPLLSGFSGSQHIAAYEEFLAYKVRVPVRGAIMMDETMEKLVLVKGWKKGASWSFPRGKINKDEKDLDCAIREVWEETGFDIRQAGLVPNQDADVKYIDITMREQHMRLFVFRGVSEKTHFEPKTRKEISKISWYNVRDLPGFKKQNKGVDSAAQANKFYMVAPFLGPLKKWINQQRQKDVVAQSMPQTITEDEGLMTEDYSTLPQTVDRSDELRGLLGVGGVSPMPQHAQQPGPVMSNKPDLLAMLQGRSGAHTPFEQVHSALPQPISPEPQHVQQPPQGYQVMPRQFPYSPHRAQPAYQRPIPTPQIFNQHAQPPFAGPHTHQQGSSVPVDPRFQQERYGFQDQQGPPPHMQRWSNPPPSELMAQGSQAAIGSGPHVPAAERLPMPRLSTHSMNLLNSFKGGNKPAASSQQQGSDAPRHTSLHQTALLDLFKKPIIPNKPVELPHSNIAEPVSPTPTNVTVKPQKLERKTTLNEITRTLPKPKTKPVITESALGLPADVPLGPKAMQTKAHTPASQVSPPLVQPPQVQARTPATGPSVAPKTILQRHAPGSVSHSQPQPPQPQKAQQIIIQKEAQASPGRENGRPGPPFTILTRPGSARASPSPLTSGGESFQPQVLKRPEPDVSPPLPTNSDGSSNKRDHLLSLFNQGNKAAPKKAEVPLTTPETHQSNILNLFNGPPQMPRTQEPPRAPSILPERHASHQGPAKKPPTQALLGLFTESTVDSNNNQDNVATPISPFALGTPVTKRVTSPTQMLPIGHSRPPPPRQASEAVSVDRSRLNSVASSVSNVGSGRATPTEAKGFLLDYLNGVVQKEGGRGRR